MVMYPADAQGSLWTISKVRHNIRFVKTVRHIAFFAVKNVISRHFFVVKNVAGGYNKGRKIK